MTMFDEIWNDILEDCKKMPLYDDLAVDNILTKNLRVITGNTLNDLLEYFCVLVDRNAPEHFQSEPAWIRYMESFNKCEDE